MVLHVSCRLLSTATRVHHVPWLLNQLKPIGTLSVLELTCVVDTMDTDDLEHPDPWKSWTIPELGSMRGFGLLQLKG